jgi:hypothetical protein
VPTVLAVVALAACGGGDESAPAQPLTVEEALEADPEELVVVRGFFVQTSREARLCSALAESYPPQCAGASVVLEGLPPEELPPLERAQGVAWADHPVTLRGYVVGEALRVVRDMG